MTAAEFITTMRSRGLDVKLEDGQLLIELEDGAARPTSEEHRRLQDMRPQLIAHLSGVDWSRVSLYQLDRVLEIAVPRADVPLILAPGCRIARELRGRDPKPGRVWCSCEVLDLLLTNVPPDDARKIAEARVLFDGRAVAVQTMPGERHW